MALRCDIYHRFVNHSTMSSTRTEQVSLSDQYVLLLQETIKESRVLRDQVSQKDQDTNAKLERLLNKVEELSEKIEKDSSPSCMKGKRKRSASIQVPKQCRVSTQFNVVYYRPFEIDERATCARA